MLGKLCGTVPIKFRFETKVGKEFCVIVRKLREILEKSRIFLDIILKKFDRYKHMVQAARLIFYTTGQTVKTH